MTELQQSSGGFRIPEFGKKSGLTAIRAKDTNIIVRCLNALGAMTVAKGNTNAFKYSEGNIVLSLKNISEGSASGWHWAPVMEYASATTYLPNEVVVVSPTNPDIANCTAGLWVALQSVSVANKPIWMPVTPSAYWQLIALYPVTITVCVNAVETDYYINAQPVP